MPDATWPNTASNPDAGAAGPGFRANACFQNARPAPRREPGQNRGQLEAQRRSARNPPGSSSTLSPLTSLQSSSRPPVRPCITPAAAPVGSDAAMAGPPRDRLVHRSVTVALRADQICSLSRSVGDTTGRSFRTPSARPPRDHHSRPRDGREDDPDASLAFGVLPPLRLRLRVDFEPVAVTGCAGV